MKTFLFFKQVPKAYSLCLFAVMLTLIVPVSSAIADGPTVIEALIDVKPNKINLNSTEKWMTAYIELTDTYTSDVGKIDIGSVKLNVNGYHIPAKNKPVKIGDYDSDGVPDLEVRFDRQMVQSHMFVGSEELIVGGTVTGIGVDFQGSDTVTVKAKGEKFTILQTSDIHHHASGFGPFNDYTSDVLGDDCVRGGYARLATLIGQIKAAQAAAGIDVLLLDSGDFVMGTTYDLTATDPIMLKFFQTMGYDAITLGNHDFDWSPDGLAMLLSGALGSPEGFTVPVLGSNTVTDLVDTGDDSIELLMALGVIVNKKVIDLPDGLKVGLLGLMGPDADQKAPVASPIAFDHDYAFIQRCVDDLRTNDRVDLVIVLSHGGVEPDGTGNDVDIAENVTGIDIIASGHYHTATDDAIIKGGSNSIIFSPGAYGEWLSRLDFTYSKNLGRIIGYEFTLIPVDDTIIGNPVVQGMVDSYHTAMNASLSPLGIQLGTPVSTTSFDLEMVPLQVTGLGSLCADSVRNVANALAPLNFPGSPVDLGIVSSGVIRDPIYQGNSGVITFSDVYNCLPLGISPYQTSPPGYPLMHAYLTGLEIYTVCEVGLSLSQIVDSDYYLNFSGIKIDYSPAGAPTFNGVQAVYLYAPDDLFCEGNANFIDPTDPGKLYHVVVDLYGLQMLNVLAAYGFPLAPKNAAGGPIYPADYINFRIDADPGPGFQELKEWMALLNYLPELGESIPPTIYGPEGIVKGRVNFVEQ